MCDPATAALILTAVGGGTKAVNTGISLRRQDKAAARGIREQGELQRQANVSVNEQIADIAGSTGEAERAEALEGFLNTLRESSDTIGAAPDPLALGGQRFAERVEGGEAVTRQAGVERAGRLSRIDSTVQQRINEANRVAGTAGQLDELRRQSSAKDFITQLRIASKRPNTIVDALATTAQGVGSVLALGTGGGPDLSKLFNKGTLIDAPARGSGIFSVPRLGTPPPIITA